MPLRFALRLAVAVILIAFIFVAVSRLSVRRTPPRPHLPPRTPLPLSGVTVILDPGHGGEDPGAVTRFAIEAAYTYRAAMEIGQALTAQGARVIFTVSSSALDPAYCARQAQLPVPRDACLAADNQPIRERHSPRQLWMRAVPARLAWQARTGPDPERRFFFLSLHLDDSSDTKVRGALVCFDKRRPVPEFARALAVSIARDGLARPGEGSYGQQGLSARELGVLNPQYNPVPQSALLEMATMSHLDDIFQAADPAWRAQMTSRVIQAITSVRRPDQQLTSR